MRKTAPLIASALSISLVGVVMAQAPATRPVEVILAEMEKVPQPEIDMQKRNDPAAKEEIQAKIQAYVKQLDPFRDELIRSHPDHELAGMFVQQKLMGKLYGGTAAKDVVAEAEEFIKQYPSKAAGDAGLMVRASAQLGNSFTYGEGTAALKPLIDRFGERDPRVQEIRYMVLGQAKDLPTDKRISLIKLFAEENPGTPFAEAAAGQIKQLEGIGKPFELAFKDFTTEKPISIADMKGKVVIIDFWATWCGPCIEALPELKEIYEKNKDKGLAVIGVSLDAPEARGGKAALTKFLAENKIPWPNYYQGSDFEGEFTVRWGINAIPQLFLIDKEGKLASVDARSNLEEQVTKLLAK